MSKSKTVRALLAFMLTAFPASPVLADGGADLEQAVGSLSMQTTLYATVAVLALIGVATFAKHRWPRLDHLLFWSIVATVLAATGILIGSTVYLNNISWSKGPVHWHADFEVWACGQQVELKDPTGRLSNKIGTSTLHEHNDKRIHLEGVAVEPHDASLAKFFRVIGGQLDDNSITVPTTAGTLTYKNGDACKDASGQLQVFAYQTTPDNYYTLTKLDDPAAHIIKSSSQVPPGDCIIFEFGEATDTTERMCRSYEVALQIGRLKGRTNGN